MLRPSQSLLTSFRDTILHPNGSHRPAYRLWSRYDDFDPCRPLDDDSIPLNLPLDSYRVNVSFSVYYCLYDSTCLRTRLRQRLSKTSTYACPAVSKTSTFRCEQDQHLAVSL